MHNHFKRDLSVRNHLQRTSKGLCSSKTFIVGLLRDLLINLEKTAMEHRERRHHHYHHRRRRRHHHHHPHHQQQRQQQQYKQIGKTTERTLCYILEN